MPAPGFAPAYADIIQDVIQSLGAYSAKQKTIASQAHFVRL